MMKEMVTDWRGTERQRQRQRKEFGDLPTPLISVSPDPQACPPWVSFLYQHQGPISTHSPGYMFPDQLGSILPFRIPDAPTEKLLEPPEVLGMFLDPCVFSVPATGSPRSSCGP